MAAQAIISDDFFFFFFKHIASLSCLELGNSSRVTKTGIWRRINCAWYELHKESFTEAPANPRRVEED